MAETQLTMGSLFDGAGGFPLAAVRSGIKPLWASEIEPLPIRVTRARFPEMEHLGDISKIHGGAIPPVDVITFGSPCFPAGTLILTERGHVPIEDVTADDRVLTHRGRWRQVTATGNRTADTIVLSDGVNHLECTSNHPILEYGPEEQWTQAGDMQGRQWCLSGMWRNRIAATVRRISGGRQNQTVYNLAVADDESYTANRIIVHNCQDLSVAGKREGLKGGRSGLFHEAIRVIREMREATGGQRPRICLWKTCPVHSAQTEVRILAKSSEAWPLWQAKTINVLDLRGGAKQEPYWQTVSGASGGWSTRDTGESPRCAAESFLSDILEPDTEERSLRAYYLTPRVCQGILRRAREMGKVIPEILLGALKRQAGEHRDTTTSTNRNSAL